MRNAVFTRCAILAGFILVVALAAILVCFRKRTEVRTAGNPPRPEIKHVILLTIDTLRADALPAYGNTRIETPHLSDLCKRSILFERALSTSPWTRPSILSILTGLPPSIHAATSKAIEIEAVLPDSIPTLATLMDRAGYRTAGIGYNPFLSYSPNTKRGFQEYYFYPLKIVESDGTETTIEPFEPEGNLEDAREAGTAINDRSATTVLTELTMNWLSRHAKEKFFLWLHYLDPHVPYTPPRECLTRVTSIQDIPEKGIYKTWLARFTNAISTYLGAERRLLHDIGTTRDMRTRRILHNALLSDRHILQGLYEAEVIHIDDAIGEIVARLKALNIFDETLIIVTSDHGEEFFDHGKLEHGHSFYQELLHVPLVLKLPGASQPRKVKDRVSTLNILPTILDLCSITPDPGGIPLPSSLARFWEDPSSPAWSPVLVAESVLYGEPGLAIVFDDMKYIRRGKAGGEALFHLATDPAEKTSLVEREPARMKQARRILDAHDAWSRSVRKRVWTDGIQTARHDKKIRNHLRSLGYLK